MSADIFHRLAQQCRDLMLRARTEAAREQLRIWLEEFEAQAAAVEAEIKNRNPHYEARC